MSAQCQECGETTVWNQELGSSICINCGTLADPTQSLLTSHLEPAEGSTREHLWNEPYNSTLKGRNGWTLAGQSKEARDRQNTVAMHVFIQTLAMRISSHGIGSRAQGLFDQAMRKGRFRWGRRAKLLAGASVAVALRESHKSDILHDIAYLLEEPFVSLARAFTSLVSLLQLKLTSADPTVHLPLLQTHLLTLLQEASSRLPTKLSSTLAPLIPRLPTVMRTASSLSALLARTNTLSNLPTPPTACALVLLSLEAELQSSLPTAGALADALGFRFNTGRSVVMQRYKIIYDLVEEWIREVPWLEAHERKKGNSGRSKVAKRVVVARGLKDVVQFQEEIWRKKFETDDKPQVHLHIDADEDEGGRDQSEGEDRASPVRVSTENAVPSRPRRKRHERTMGHISSFLLNPTSNTGHLPLSSDMTRAATDAPDLLTHMLTADTYNLSHAFGYAPTRLQLLAVSRGGANEHNIPDEELFAEGELDALIRSPEEVSVVRTAMDWDDDDDVHPGENGRGRAGIGKKGVEGTARDRDKAPACGSKRIDMDALARILNPSDVFDEECEESELQDDNHTTCANIVDTDEIVEDWRPLSPGGNGFDEDRYES